MLLYAEQYASPEKSIPENKNYNYYVSNICIWSEHCVSFLKGRWSCLRDLWLHVDDQKGLAFTTLWVMSCIHLHNFAIMHEQSGDVQADTFFIKGQRIIEQERQLWETWGGLRRQQLAEEELEYDDEENIQLLEGKLKWEKLKQAMREYFYMEGS
jgi:hypothetical protein